MWPFNCEYGNRSVSLFCLLCYLLVLGLLFVYAVAASFSQCRRACICRRCTYTKNVFLSHNIVTLADKAIMA